MKRKRGGKRWRKWLPTLALLLLVSPILVLSVGLAILWSLLRYEDATTTPEGALNGRYAQYLNGWRQVNARNSGERPPPAYTILQEQDIEAPPGRLYTLGWYDAEARPCLAVSLVQGAGDYYETIWQRYAEAQCSADEYSIDWYLEEGGWGAPPFAVVYGFSGAADLVEVTWGDGAVTRVMTQHDSYAAILERRSETIRRVEFVKTDGGLVHSFKPLLRLGRALCERDGRTLECAS